MRKLCLILLMCLIYCSPNADGNNYINSSLILFERNVELFQGVRINIIRIPNRQKNITYEVRIDNQIGFAVFQIKPEKLIIKDFYSKGIDPLIINKIDSLVSKDGIPLLIEVLNDNYLLEFKSGEHIYTTLKGDSITNVFYERGMQLNKIGDGWVYFKKRFNRR